MSAKTFPEKYHTITPALIVRDAARLIDFLKQVFAAEEVERYAEPDGAILHAEIKIGDSILMIGEAMEEPMPAALYLFVDDVDETYKKALQADATSIEEPKDQFYGARVARVKDPFGNRWAIATHKEDVSYEELQRRVEAMKKPEEGEKA
jgi:PhnB protein